jgi:pilus assembly protein CpaB
MAKKYNYVFYVALLVAVVATFGAYQVMESSRRSNQVATRPVVVASRNMPAGALLDDGLRVEHWPSPIVPDSAFGDASQLVGRVSRIPIFAGEVIVPGRLADEGVSPGLEAMIPRGKRAMSLPVDQVSGVAGMIQPSSRVDLLLTLDGSNGRTGKLFMSNMKILAMGTQVFRNEKGEPIETSVATLEVFPDESERLAVAQSQGKIQLVLRGFLDGDTVKTRGATATDVVASLRDVASPGPRRTTNPPQQKAAAPVVEAPVPTAPAPQPTAQKPDTLRIPVYRGRAKTEEKFGKDSVRRDTIKPYPSRFQR